MADFPRKGLGLTQGESPSLYDIDVVEKGLKADTDGGYEFRRNRSTRARRKKIMTGFLGLSNADYLVLDAFWTTHTTVEIFSYFDYVHGVTRQVRFDEFKPDYVGIGPLRIWNVKIKLSEV